MTLKHEKSYSAGTHSAAPTDHDVARYIADITIDLAALAGAAKMPMLTYFLHMARVEAEQQLHERSHNTPHRAQIAKNS